MNAKSMLIAAAVLATPACAVSEEDVTSASNEAVTARVDLLGETYLSRDTFTVTEYRRRPNGDYVEDTITVRYRLRFIPAGTDYTYDGEGTMEYETVIDRVEIGKPELAFSDDTSYFAKRKDRNSFSLFDCDSTSRCTDGNDVSKLDTFTQDGKKVVKISALNQGDFSRPGIYLAGVTQREILFDPTTAAPDVIALPSTITCEAGDHVLTITPAVPPHTTGAGIELTEKATGKVLDADHYSPVVRDVSGHVFVVSAWSGRRISLGDASARYENEVTGVTLDFPSGTCKVAE